MYATQRTSLHGAKLEADQMGPLLKNKGERVITALADFVGNFADAWNRLYKENALATTVVTGAAIMAGGASLFPFVRPESEVCIGICDFTIARIPFGLTR
jgi:hypothetical protein